MIILPNFLLHVNKQQKEKMVMNMISLLLFPVFDWSIIMIGPGGLLLVVPTYLQSLFESVVILTPLKSFFYYGFGQ